MVALAFNDERHRVHSKSGHAKLQPIPHDALNFGSHCRVVRIQIGLELIEPMEVPLARKLVVVPGTLLDAWKYESFSIISRPTFRPRVPTPESRILVGA